MSANDSTNRTCERCGTAFRTFPCKLRIGEGRFCGKRCANSHRPEKFWAKVMKTGSCWLWLGKKDRHGYGRLHVDGKDVFSHRYCWELLHGPIPYGHELLHDCPGGDNPACCNPTHLRVGTHAENMADAVKKGQHKKGENRPNAKLTETLVRQIRDKYKAGGVSHNQLAKEFGVSQLVICYVINRKTWKHVL